MNMALLTVAGITFLGTLAMVWVARRQQQRKSDR